LERAGARPALRVVHAPRHRYGSGQPIGALVEDCKATPKETLWEKLKKHL
jgi:hypothetical protein